MPKTGRHFPWHCHFPRLAPRTDQGRGLPRRNEPGLHGDPNIAKKDHIIRGAIELDGYTVIVVQSRDLTIPRLCGNTCGTSPRRWDEGIWLRKHESTGNL